MGYDYNRNLAHQKFLNENYEVIAVIKKKDFEESLKDILADYQEKKYDEILITSGEKAFENYEWQMKDYSYIVYMKPNRKHIDFRADFVNIVSSEFINTNTGESKRIFFNQFD